MNADPPDSAIQLSILVEAIAGAEAEHRQNLPLREDFVHMPVGCSCGAEYGPDGWVGSKRHMQEVFALAVVRALHRPCETCLGTGSWHKMAGILICPDCDGRGRVLTPLPPLVFQDERGDTWKVERIDERDDEMSSALVWRDR